MTLVIYQPSSLLTSTPTTPTKTKKATILTKTTTMLTCAPARLVTTVSAIRPRMSSMRAAAKIVLPTLVESLPSSVRVSTVMLTEVAVRMTPMKMFWSRTLPGCANSPRLKKKASPAPIASGTSTPHSATTNPAFPVFFSSWMSVPIPAVNMMTMTPSSDTCARKSVACRTLSIAGPRISPASRAPTTWGIW